MLTVRMVREGRCVKMSNSGVLDFSIASKCCGVSITVCVPVYNVERYLRECLDSIFAQDYPDFDVVMVDDGSTDGSGAICNEYVEKHPQRAFVVHKDNEGLLLARREGFARAAGQYVMCVDSDDMLAPGAISAIAAAISSTGADVVRYLPTRELDDVASLTGKVPYRYFSLDEKPVMLQALCCSTSGSENPMWFKAIRRECVGTDVEYSDFKGLTFAEDFLQTLTVYDRAETFCFLDATLYYYRPGSGITHAYSPHFYRDVCRCLDVAEGFARRWEHDYSCGGLKAGLAACRLDSASQYAEWMAAQGDKTGLDRLRRSDSFERCATVKGVSAFLRFDRKIVIAALKLRIYFPISVVVKAKAIKAGLLGFIGRGA